MTDRQENLLSMYLTLYHYLPRYTSVTQRLPRFNENYSSFKDFIPQIQAATEKQKVCTRGVTAKKNKLRKALTVTTMDNVRKLKAFAVFTSNHVLKGKVNFGVFKLTNASFNAVLAYSTLTYNLAQENLSELRDYGIDASTQKGFLAQIDAYKDALGATGVSRAEMKKITYQLKELFSRANKAVYYIDLAVGIVSSSEQEFYIGYRSARKVIRNQSVHVVVKGTVTDQVSRSPIKGATLSFSREGATNTKAISKERVIVKKTNPKGGYSVKKLPAGRYTVVVKKNGYVNHEAKVTIVEGEKFKLDIGLERLQRKVNKTGFTGF